MHGGWIVGQGRPNGGGEQRVAGEQRVEARQENEAESAAGGSNRWAHEALTKMSAIVPGICAHMPVSRCPTATASWIRRLKAEAPHGRKLRPLCSSVIWLR